MNSLFHIDRKSIINQSMINQVSLRRRVPESAIVDIRSLLLCREFHINKLTPFLNYCLTYRGSFEVNRA